MAKAKQIGANKKRNWFLRTWDNFLFKLEEFGKRFVDGSIGTKLSHFVFGAGNFYHKQYIKGALFLLLQVGIILFMVLCPSVNGEYYGYKALVNLALGGNEGGDFDPETGELLPPSDDKLRLLFGLVTIAVIVIFFIIWLANIKSSYKADLDVKQGKITKQELNENQISCFNKVCKFIESKK